MRADRTVARAMLLTYIVSEAYGYGAGYAEGSGLVSHATN